MKFFRKRREIWDSLKGVNLLLEVEKTFSVKIPTSELQTLIPIRI